MEKWEVVTYPNGVLTVNVFDTLSDAQAYIAQNPALAPFELWRVSKSLWQSYPHQQAPDFPIAPTPNAVFTPQQQIHTKQQRTK